MGYDPYWPTCLATINTVVVPAGKIRLKRFEEVLAALQANSRVDLKTIREGEGGSHELIDPANFRQGVAILDVARDSGKGRTEVLEPNSQAQVVFGVYDFSTATNVYSRPDLHPILHTLQQSFSTASDELVFVLLAIGAEESHARDGVVELPDSADSNITFALEHAYSLLRAKLCTQVAKLADKDLSHANQTIEANGQAGLSNGTSAHNPTQEVAKGRYTILLGLMNLFVGAWPDALRRLAEGSALAREGQYALFQARALEALVLCMGFMVWKSVTFEIPEVCEQAYNTSQLLSKSSIFGRPASMAMPSQAKADATLGSSQKFLKYAPVMLEAVLNVYEGLSTSASKMSESIMLRQSRIRSLNMLFFVSSTNHARLVDDLEDFFIRKRHPASAAQVLASTTVGINIPAQLKAIIPVTETELVSSDGMATALAVINTLSAMGSLRREAFIVRELLQRLAPALKSAKHLGASEAGVHPSSASAHGVKPDSSMSMRTGVRSLIALAAKAFGIYFISPNHSDQTLALTKSQIEENLVSWCMNRTEGDLFLKAEVLTLCINLCDSVGDAQESSNLVSAILRLAIPNATISSSRSGSSLLISTNEQIRLLEYLRQISTSGNNEDAIRMPYWNDFLVREVQILQQQDGSTLVSHAPGELLLADDSAGSQVKDPFIFNPFARHTAMQAAPVVVAGEVVVFSVQLQNPLEVPVDVSDITLVAEGCEFEPSHHSVVLGALSCQLFTLTGTANRSGDLKIVGCEAVIEGCRRQLFPIMRPSWQPPVKIKHRMSRTRRVEGAPLFLPEDVKLSDPEVLKLTVLEPQPELEIVSSSLTESSIMLLEGEKRTFSLTIRNASKHILSNFLLLTSNDNVSRGLRESLSKKELLPVDTYEVQHQLKYRSPLQVSDTAGHQTELRPQEESIYSVEVFGRPGLGEAAIHIDFARLGQPRAEIKQTFYTRQIRFPIALTVNGSIEIVRCNILPIQGDLPKGYESRLRGTSKINGGSHELNEQQSRPHDGFCMLSLDLRNVWPQPLTVELTSLLSTTIDSVSAGKHEDKYVASETIQPGHVSRIIVIIPRLFIADPFAPIPSLEKQRQFVVSTSKMSQEAEASTRANFWFREELLKHIIGMWKEVKTGRKGEIDLRKGIRVNLNARMIDVLRVDHVEISCSLRSTADAPANVLNQLEGAHYRLQVEAFATLKVTVRNRSKDRLPLLLRLQPCLRDQPHNIALDLSRRLAWSGVLQRVLHPPLEPGDVREVDLGLVILAAGSYEVNATVEEIKPRSQTIPGVDPLGLHSQRRIWHAQTPCYIDGHDVED